MLTFPIFSNFFSDQYALLKYFSQKLKKFLLPCLVKNCAYMKKILDSSLNPLVLNNDTPLFVRIFSKEKGAEAGLAKTIYEKFLMNPEDNDFHLVLNFLKEIKRKQLEQIFGKGLALIEMKKLVDGDAQALERFVDVKKNIYCSKKNAKDLQSSLEFISLFGGIKESDEIANNSSEFSIESLFSIPTITYEGTEHKVSETKKNLYSFVLPQTANSAKLSKEESKENSSISYIQTSIKYKGLLNIEMLIKTLIIYFNHVQLEYLFERVCEVFEINLLKNNEFSQLIPSFFLNQLYQFSQSAKQLATLASKIHCPLFSNKKIHLCFSNRNHIPTACKIIYDVLNKGIQANLWIENNHCFMLLIVNVVEGACDCASTASGSKVGDSPEPKIVKTIIIKNIAQSSMYALYSALKQCLPFKEVEMMNRSVEYELIVLSKNIIDIIGDHKEGIIGSDNNIEVIDCSKIARRSSKTIQSIKRDVPANEESKVPAGATPSHPAKNTIIQENLPGSMKIMHSIYINNDLSIPRTVYLRVAIKKSALTIDTYNFNKKTVSKIDKIIAAHL